jgi:TRAP-type transport system small permease protein
MENQGKVEGPSDRFNRMLWRISQGMAGVGAAMYGVMMLVSVIDVGGRYFFKHPLLGATELVGLMLVVGGTWGMAYCQVLKMHIRIDLVYNKFPALVQSILWAISCLVCLTTAALIAWQGFFKAGQYYITELGTRTDILGIPLWPFIALMAIGFSWLGFVFLIELIKTIIGAVKR